MPQCLNCNHSWKDGETFCSNCSQRTNTSKIGVSGFVRDFFYFFFGLNSKIWKTIIQLFIPAKVAIEFINGKRVRYYPLMRLFIISLVAFFTLIVLVQNDSIDFFGQVSEYQEKQSWQDVTLKKIDKLAPVLAIDSIKINALKDQLFYRIEEQNKTNTILGKEIQYNDFFKMDALELKAHYQLQDGFEGLFFVQFQKFVKSPSNAIKYILGNGIWTIILMMLMVTLVFRFLYFRSEYGYSDHFLLLLNGQSRFQIAGIIVLLIYWFGGNGIFLILPMLIAVIYLFIEMKIMYKKNFFLTTIHFLIALTTYFVILTLSFFLINLVSFFLL